MIVRRAIAIVAGAAAGVALWYLAVWAREAMKPEPIMSFGDCRHYGYDCVGYGTPAQVPDAPTAPAAPTATPCKAWIAGSRGGIAALSQCLHEARGGDEAERLERIRWARRTGQSS